MARPSKMTDQRVAALLYALEAGATRTGACASADISLSTLHRWLEADEFREAIERAEAKAETNYLERIVREVKKPDGQWTAAAWWLERRLPDVYGRRDRVDLQVSLKSQVEKVAAETGLSSEEVWAELATILPGAR